MEQIDTIKAERDTVEQDLKVQQDDMGQYYMLTISSGMELKPPRV